MKTSFRLKITSFACISFLALVGCQTKSEPASSSTTTTTTESTSQPLPTTAGQSAVPVTGVNTPGTMNSNQNTMPGPGAMPNNVTEPTPYTSPNTDNTKQPVSTGGVVQNSGASVKADTTQLHGDTPSH